jgi:hypothetical protein
MAISDSNDAMIRRLESELRKQNEASQGLIANANDAQRDLNDAEKETLGGIQTRMGQLRDQLDILERTSKDAVETGERLRQIDVATTQARKVGNQVVEYRSAGAWIADYCAAQTGNKTAQERLEVFYRTADHQLTTDNPGVIPDPVVGGLINFIDSARPITSFLGPQPLEQGVFYRPHRGRTPDRRHDGGCHREGGARFPEDADRPVDGHRRNVWRLRQRVASEHRLVATEHHGPDRQRPRRPIRDRD